MLPQWWEPESETPRGSSVSSPPSACLGSWSQSVSVRGAMQSGLTDTPSIESEGPFWWRAGEGLTLGPISRISHAHLEHREVPFSPPEELALPYPAATEARGNGSGMTICIPEAGSGSTGDADIWPHQSPATASSTESLEFQVGMTYFFTPSCLRWQHGGASKLGRAEISEGKEVPVPHPTTMGKNPKVRMFKSSWPEPRYPGRA